MVNYVSYVDTHSEKIGDNYKETLNCDYIVVNYI